MKKRYITVVFFVGFLSGSFTFAQVTTAEAIYKTKIQRQDKKTTKTNPSKRIEMILKEVENIRVHFLYNNGKAVFKVEEGLELDYLTKLNRSSAKTIVGVRDNYYYDVPKNKVITDREISGKSYNIFYNLDGFNWELHDEIKNIHNYTCYKATTQYSYKNKKGTIITLDIVAWYTPQIPIPLGPKNYTGLPGLVLELKEGPRTIYLTELRLNPDRKIKIDEVPKGQEVTEKEFKKITSKAYGNLMDSMKNE